ncbi:MAG: adenylate cyclase class 1 [Gammaproteobacteria bacterium]|jgi:adenylate cyclase class 1
MTKTLPIEHSPNHLNRVKENFLKVNRMRLARTQEYLNTEQGHFLELIPLLFHVNHPELPGFVSEETAAGISQYSPAYAALKAMKTLFPQVKLERRAHHQMDIYSLFCMGSSGTIAYTRKSDFDIWLVHAPSLSKQQIEELTEKARYIETWAMRLRLEVHFFVLDTATFKQGKHESLSTESSGSAQHYLLLEEFYRSSLLLAGRYPIWWLVPAEEEENYDDYTADLLSRHLVDEFDIIDFGGVGKIPANEFFGAAVWQIYKGISSPFKSVMKLLLMEVYASEYPHIDLLSLMYKKAIFEGNNNFVDIDPYIMMYRKIESYLMTRMDKERLDLFRKCFYFKININLSKKLKLSNIDWRRELMTEMVLDWGWDENKLSTMDDQGSWRIDDVIKERRMLINTFTTSYRFLSDFARKHSEVSRLSQSELNVLGRKLYAAFERKSGKIEVINRGIAPNILEHELSICHVNNKDNPDSWLLYRGSIDPDDREKHECLKRTESVLELMAWCHFNKIINSNTALSLRSSDLSLSVKELKDIHAALEKLYPDGKVPQSGFKDLSQPARINTTGLFINIGLNSTPASNNEESYLSSSRDDALSYGALHENLTKSFDLVITTTWEEVLIFHYEGIEGLLQCLSEYLRWAPLQSRIAPPAINAFSFSSTYANNIANRIEELFSAVINTYYSHPTAEHTRYILMIEDVYYICDYRKDTLHHEKIVSYPYLVKRLASAKTDFSPVVFDKNTVWHTPLADIYKINRAGIIQMFYLIHNKTVTIYIIDERGALFIQQIPFHDSQSLINHFTQFFGSTIKRRNILSLETEQDIEDIPMEFYQLKKSGTHNYGITLIEVKPGMNARNYFNIQVMGNLHDDKKTTLTIYCDDEEFSSLEHGNNLFKAVASHILEGRVSKQSYPIYITDIDLSRSLLFDPEIDSLQTVHFLKYKKRIEDKLNTALAEL